MNEKGIAAAALSIRSLSMDAIQKAKSGHPGIAMGASELAALLYGEIMKHNPANSKWADRDRFVLSAGHGSMLLYSILHLSGYKVSLDDIKNFRQIGSKCAGHPEYGLTDGVECTTGPLGQGVSMAVGMAIAETMLAARYNTEKHTIVDHYTYSLVGEGCLQEGVASEACSLAGHLKLGKLIVFYDENRISIDGCTDIAFTDDIQKRYEAYGWQVLKGSMYDVNQIVKLTEEAKACTDKPTISRTDCWYLAAISLKKSSKIKFFNSGFFSYAFVMSCRNLARIIQPARQIFAISPYCKSQLYSSDAMRSCENPCA